MANIKSSAKRNRLIQKANIRNKAAKSLLKTNIKKFNAAVAGGNRDTAQEAYKIAVKTIDSAAGKKLIHKNNAARKISSLTRSLNAMLAN